MPADATKPLLAGAEDETKKQRQKDKKELGLQSSAAFNRAVLFTWPLFSAFLLSQPFMANYFNNKYHAYSAEYDLYGKDGGFKKSLFRAGICVTPAAEMLCADGQNFTALAMKYRGVPFGCGCGEGVLGEGLCPMTFYGYTLSDYVSTGPAIAAMLGLGFFPLLGTWMNTAVITVKGRPSPPKSSAGPREVRQYELDVLEYPRVVKAHNWSMYTFQSAYILWGMASDCIFPTAHAVLTVAFLGAFLIHWVITAYICKKHWGFDALESKVTFGVAVCAIVVISLGATPRVFLTINGMLGKSLLPNLVRGIGKYAFWFAEAAGLSLTFGAYPMILIGFLIPKYSLQKPKEFCLWEHDLQKEKWHSSMLTGDLKDAFNENIPTHKAHSNP